MLLFVVFSAVTSVVTAVSSGAAVLAMGFLYPQSVSVAGLSGLLWLVIPASLSSVVLSRLLLEGLMLLRDMKFPGISIPAIRIVEMFAEGAFLALALTVFAHLEPDARISSGTALAASMIGAFVRYFAGLYVDELDPDDVWLLNEVNQATISSEQDPFPDRETPH